MAGEGVKTPHVGGWGGGLTRQKDGLRGLLQLHRTKARTEYLGYVRDGKPPDCIILFTIKDMDFILHRTPSIYGPLGGVTSESRHSANNNLKFAITEPNPSITCCIVHLSLS